jgi:muramoyltetrapeptide carboxypeptidase
MIKPKHLEIGDRVAVVAPASSYDEQALQLGVLALESLGLKVEVYPATPCTSNYLAGEDATRLADLEKAFSDKKIRGVFCSRGGYGSMRLLPRLRPEILTQNPKVFVAYSDLTSLLNLLTTHNSLITFHGPVVAKDLNQQERPLTLQWLEKVIMGVEPLGEISAHEVSGKEHTVLYPGQARGILIGGNLSMIAATMGTPAEIQTDGKILFLEEIGEAPYRVDRLFQQLILSKKLSKVSGILLGEFVDCVDKEHPNNPEKIIEVLGDVLTGIKIPILYGFPAGHCFEKVTLPLGVSVELDADQGILRFMESATQ